MQLSQGHHLGSAAARGFTHGIDLRTLSPLRRQAVTRTYARTPRNRAAAHRAEPGSPRQRYRALYRLKHEALLCEATERLGVPLHRSPKLSTALVGCARHPGFHFGIRRSFFRLQPAAPHRRARLALAACCLRARGHAAVRAADLPANPRAELQDNATRSDQLPIGWIVFGLTSSGLHVEK